MEFVKFLGVLFLGIVIGAGGMILYARVQSGPFPATASAADNYNACIQDAKVGIWEHGKDVDKWLADALAKCAKQYRADRQNGR
jgi:hypothetical protein